MSTKKYLDYDGLKYLWSKINNKTDLLIYEIVNIELTTNQPGGGVTTTVTVTVDGEATEYQYDNNPIIVKIKSGSSYTVSFGDLVDYKTPSSVSYTATAGNTRSISLSYNATLLTIKFTGYTSNKATVQYGSVTKSVANNGTTLIPYGQSVSISAPTVSNYKTPNATTFTSNSVSKNVTLAYRQVTLTIKFSGLSSTSLGSVTVTGENTTTQTVTHNKTAKVPYGANITITPIDIEGYTSPNPISNSYTSNTTITLEYAEMLLAIRILGTSNIAYTQSEWLNADDIYPGEQFQGVYITDGQNGFTVAPTGWYEPSSSTERSVWGANTLVNDAVDLDGDPIATMTTTTDGEEALLDFNGTDNTACILLAQCKSKGTYFNGPPAAKFCTAYLLSDRPASIDEGYEAYYHLPSIGECDMIYKNLDEINECLELAGGEPIGTEDMWSSTQCDATNAWLYNMGFGAPMSYSKTGGRCQVRPVIKNSPKFQNIVLENGDRKKGVAVFSGVWLSWIKFREQDGNEVVCVTPGPSSYTWREWIEDTSYIFNTATHLPFASELSIDSSNYVRAVMGSNYDNIYYDASKSDKVNADDYIIPGGTYHWRQNGPL